jgi:carboxymethylenebutenolidase
MCFEPDSLPPIVKGAATRTNRLTLRSDDGNEFLAFEAFADTPGGSAVVVLPDVRGLFPFYEELAERFAEAGHDSVAIDYFGRTAGTEARADEFPFMDHVAQTTDAGIAADVGAAVARLRSNNPAARIFTVGFCFGGSASWRQAAAGHGLAGVIGFYGHPDRRRNDGSGPVMDVVGQMTCPVLGLVAGDDPGIPAEAIEAFDAALTSAGVSHELVTYPDTPHSFFDRRYAEYAEQSADAWQRILAFIG